jgi:hypothetical protein
MTDVNQAASPAKSRYVLLDHNSYTSHLDKFSYLQPLLEVPGGILFLNPDSACSSISS